MKSGSEAIDSAAGKRDPNSRLLEFARKWRERPDYVPRSPGATDDSPGIRYARAIATLRRYGFKV